MKGLGLAGAGLGAAAATAPVFHDLDEVVSSSTAEWKRPWYVRDRDLENPTVPIDWGLVERVDSRLVKPHGYKDPVYGKFPDNKDVWRIASEWHDARHPGWKGDQNWIAAPGDPRFPGTLRDEALRGAIASHQKLNDPGLKGKTWYSGLEQIRTPEEMGVPKWSGTPEENLRMLKAVVSLLGGQDVGVTEVTSNTKKLVYDIDRDGKRLVFGGSEPKETDTAYYIPDDAGHFITYTNVQPTELSLRAPSLHGRSATTLAYTHWRRIELTVKEFLRGLGYYGLSGSSYGGLGHSNAFGTLSGVGEHGRMGVMVISPEYGSSMRMMSKVPTNLPLAPTKPIDAGIYKFCKSCKICADDCPYGSLPQVDADWEPTNMSPEQAATRAKGYKGWWVDYTKCTFCVLCLGMCPFTATKHSPIHGLSSILLGITGANITPLNQFMANMGRIFGYGAKDPESWWDLNNEPTHGISTTFTETSI